MAAIVTKQNKFKKFKIASIGSTEHRSSLDIVRYPDRKRCFSDRIASQNRQ
jgi:hypothetical protein